MNEIELIINLIKEERKKQGLTQVQLANIAKVNEKYYGRIERMESIPTIQILIKLCNVLEIKISLNEYTIN